MFIVVVHCSPEQRLFFSQFILIMETSCNCFRICSATSSHRSQLLGDGCVAVIVVSQLYEFWNSKHSHPSKLNSCLIFAISLKFSRITSLQVYNLISRGCFFIEWNSLQVQPENLEHYPHLGIHRTVAESIPMYSLMSHTALSRSNYRRAVCTCNPLRHCDLEQFIFAK